MRGEREREREKLGFEMGKERAVNFIFGGGFTLKLNV